MKRIDVDVYMRSIQGLTKRIGWTEQVMRRHINTIVINGPYTWYPVKGMSYSELCEHALKLNKDLIKLRTIRDELWAIVKQQKNREKVYFKINQPTQ